MYHEVEDTDFAGPDALAKFTRQVDSLEQLAARAGQDGATMGALLRVTATQARLTNSAKQFTHRLLQGGAGGPLDFIRALRHQYGQPNTASNLHAYGGGVGGVDRPHWHATQLDWSALIRTVRRTTPFPRATRSTHLLGALTYGMPKAKAPPKPKAQKAVLEAAVRPAINPDVVVTPAEGGAGSVETDKQETDQNIVAMWRVVEDRARNGLETRALDLCMSHQSFAHFVENVFAMSFLVKDGRFRLVPGKEGLVVEPVAKRMKKEAAGMAEKNTQFAMSYDMQFWKEMKEIVRREDVLMPERE